MASIDRLARSLVDLRGLIDEITGKGAEVEFLSEGLIFAPGVSDPRSTLLLGVLGSFAEFERAIIHERQAEGIALAKKAGKYKGRQRVLTREQADSIRERARAGARPTKLADQISKGIRRKPQYRLPCTSEGGELMTFLNILGYLFWPGAAGILITKVRETGIIAGLVRSVLPIVGLAISLVAIGALGGVLAGTARQFVDEQEAQPTSANLVNSPQEALNQMLSDVNSPEGYEGY